MSKIHWQTSAMNTTNEEQGSVTVSIFKLLFIRTDVMLQVFFTHKKENKYLYTLPPKKVQISSQNQVQLNEQKRTGTAFVLCFVES